MPLVLVSLGTAAELVIAAVLFFLFLVAFCFWDYHCLLRNEEERWQLRAELAEAEREPKPYRVTGGGRRGPEPLEHTGKQRLGL
jgi:hypothetical protein